MIAWTPKVFSNADKAVFPNVNEQTRTRPLGPDLPRALKNRAPTFVTRPQCDPPHECAVAGLPEFNGASGPRVSFSRRLLIFARRLSSPGWHWKSFSSPRVLRKPTSLHFSSAFVCRSILRCWPFVGLLSPSLWPSFPSSNGAGPTAKLVFPALHAIACTFQAARRNFFVALSFRAGNASRTWRASSHMMCGCLIDQQGPSKQLFGSDRIHDPSSGSPPA